MEVSRRQLEQMGGKLIEPQYETTVFKIDRDYKDRISKVTAGGYTFDIFRTATGKVQSMVANKLLTSPFSNTEH